LGFWLYIFSGQRGIEQHPAGTFFPGYWNEAILSLPKCTANFITDVPGDMNG
jgi:hypothetical protein